MMKRPFTLGIEIPFRLSIITSAPSPAQDGAILRVLRNISSNGFWFSSQCLIYTAILSIRSWLRSFFFEHYTLGSRKLLCN